MTHPGSLAARLVLQVAVAMAAGACDFGVPPDDFEAAFTMSD